MFIAIQFTVAKMEDQPIYPPIDDWIEKMYIVYRMYLVIVKENPGTMYI